MILQRNDQIPHVTMFHQMVQSTSITTRNKGSSKKRTISESSSSESECKFVVELFMKITSCSINHEYFVIVVILE